MNMNQKRLGDIASYINGYPFKPEDRGTVGLPIIRIQDLTGNAYDIGFYDGDYPERIEINDGDVLISWSASLGVYVWDRGKALLNQHIFKVVFDKAPVNKQYFVYAVQHKLREMESKTHGATMKHIVKKDFDDTTIPFPSMEQQAEIAGTLSKVAGIVSARQRQLSVLDDLIKARFVEMFGDPVTNPHGYLVQTLQQLIDTGYITYHLDGNHGGDYPRSEEFVDSGVPYIGANCIANGEIDLSIAKYLTEERAGKLRKGIAQNEDVLFAHNATVGPTVVLHTNLPKVILSTSLTAYRCNQDKIKPNYLKAYMQSDGFVRQYSGEMKQTTRNQVPITAQKKYLFLVPPIAEQNQFAAFVAQIDKSKVAVQKALDEAQVLFDSLMQQYFG